MGKPVKYSPFKSSIIEMPVGNGEVFKHLSGCFVKMDDSGRIEVAGATDLDIVGWAMTHEQTASTTEGLTKVGVETDLQKLYKMPVYNGGSVIAETDLQGAIGEAFDIYTTANVQYADISASSTDILVGYGYEFWSTTAAFSVMIVKINIASIAYTTHS